MQRAGYLPVGIIASRKNMVRKSMIITRDFTQRLGKGTSLLDYAGKHEGLVRNFSVAPMLEDGRGSSNKGD